MDVVFRAAQDGDRAGVRNVFNFHATHGHAVYREDERDDTIFDFFAADAHAYLVAEAADVGVVGFGTLRRFKPAASFDRTAVLSYFRLPAYTGAGEGTRMPADLEAVARTQGIVHLLAHISSRNEQSLRFHLKHGFIEVGRLRGIGVKFGRPFDVVWMQKDLQVLPGSEAAR